MTESVDRLKAALKDRYDIERELGRGGMATVYLAHDKRHDRQVAIKVMRPDIAATIGSDRFLREIRIAAKLTHPHILPLHDSGETDSLLYYVMPYIEGESLRDKLARGGELPVPDAVRLLRHVVDALAMAHKRGVVHRDIKPDNVLLLEDHAFVTDFGVAKALTEAKDSDTITTFGMAVGTPAYMSPEQAAGDPNIDHRADIYAVGAMAYEMLTGRALFEGDTPQSVLAAHVSQAPDSIAELREGLPPQLAQLVMRCLEKRPADRWQSATELREQLDALAAPSGSVTPVQTWGTGVSAETMLRRHHPARVVGTYGVVAAVIALVSYGLMQGLGLPGWVLPATIAVLALGLPVIHLTGRAERRRLAVQTGVMPSTPEPHHHRWFSWRRATTAGAVAFGGLALLIGAYMAMRALGIGPVGTLVASGVLEERDRIVLAEFENSTADSTVGETVTELFRIDLAQSPAVTVLEPAHVSRVLERMQRAPDALVTPALANEVAQREGLKAVVSGEILSVGDGYVVSSRLFAILTGDVLWAGRETAASASEIVNAVDKLSASLREKIGESLRTIRADAPLAEVTTRSTEALRMFVSAEQANQHGDYERAMRLLEEAIGQDSTFAMAYRKLGVILMNQHRLPERAREAFSKAYELRDRLTERERYLAEAAYHSYVGNDAQAAADVYRTLLDKYPTDRLALNNLAASYVGLDRPDEATDLYLRSIALGGAPAVTYTNAIRQLHRSGLRDSATVILDAFEVEFPGNPEALRYRADIHAARLQYAQAEELIRELQASQRGNFGFELLTTFGLMTSAAVQGRPSEAVTKLREAFDLQEQYGVDMIGGPREVLSTTVDIVVRLRFYNDRDSALALLTSLVESQAWHDLAPSDRGYLALAGLYAEAGELGLARAQVEQYESDIDDADRDESELHVARGTIALAEGRSTDAVDEFKAHRQLFPRCLLCGLFDIARSFDAAVQTDSALVYYQQYLDAPDLDRSDDDMLALWYTLRRLGALHEQQGNRDRAIDYYDRFVTLWQNAEPSLQPQVQEVRERIARLVGEQR